MFGRKKSEQDTYVERLENYLEEERALRAKQEENFRQRLGDIFQDVQSLNIRLSRFERWQDPNGRREAVLEYAAQNAKAGTSPEDVVARAQAYLNFVEGAESEESHG